MATLLSFQNAPQNCHAQFMNQTLQRFATLTRVRHHGNDTILKGGKRHRGEGEQGGQVRNILADNQCGDYWPQMLCMTEKLLNSSIKKPFGASPDTLQDMDQQNDKVMPRSLRKYIDKFMYSQSKLLLAAAKLQQATNDGHLKKRYAQYKTHAATAEPQGHITSQTSVTSITTAPQRQSR